MEEKKTHHAKLWKRKWEVCVLSKFVEPGKKWSVDVTGVGGSWQNPRAAVQPRWSDSAGTWSVCPILDSGGGPENFKYRVGWWGRCIRDL